MANECKDRCLSYRFVFYTITESHRVCMYYVTHRPGSAVRLFTLMSVLLSFTRNFWYFFPHIAYSSDPCLMLRHRNQKRSLHVYAAKMHSMVDRISFGHCAHATIIPMYGRKCTTRTMTRCQVKISSTPSRETASPLCSSASLWLTLHYIRRVSRLRTSTMIMI